MTHVITENCICCKYTECVDVCPVNCFREGENMLVIDPYECIDCAICVSECPANAIYSEEDIPKDQLKFIELNAELSKIFSQINKTKTPMIDANKWNGVAGKLKYLKKI